MSSIGFAKAKVPKVGFLTFTKVKDHFTSVKFQKIKKSSAKTFDTLTSRNQPHMKPIAHSPNEQ